MKTKYGFLLSVLLFTILPFVNTYASEPAIHEVLINVELSENGNAAISETWDVTVTGGTEWYLSFNNMKNMKIEDLSVTDESGIPYTFADNWDINQSISQKTNRFGLLDKGSSQYEICWGIGSYGRHQFTVSYTITGLVQRYSDYAGFNHTFLSKGLTSPVEQAAVTIRYPGYRLDESTAKVWAFGYNGTINFSNNAIVADSGSRLSRDEGMIIMAQFENAYFASAPSAAGSFETIRNRALEGSYDSEGNKPINPIFIILFAVVFLVTGFAVVYTVLRSSLPDVFYRKEYGQTRNDLKRNAPENGDIPFHRDFLKTFGILNYFREAPSQVSVIRYFLLKWAREEAITEAADPNAKKAATIIILNKRSYGQDYPESGLYEMLFNASDNGRLSQKAIEKWSYKKIHEINAWYDECKSMAKDVLRREKLMMTTDVKRSFVNASIDVLRETGWQYSSRIYGLKNFLTGIHKGYHQDEINDECWEDYLIYADIFHIYDSMEDWYEDHVMDTHPYGYYLMTTAFRSSYLTGENRRTGGDGGGGSTSSGGGGGATGGGGGGSR